MSNGLLERTAATVRRDHGAYPSDAACKRVLRAAGLAQTAEAIWQIRYEIAEQSVSRHAELAAHNARYWGRTSALQDGVSRRECLLALREDRRSGAGQPAPTLAERLDAFKLAAAERAIRAQLRHIANVDLQVTLGETAAVHSDDHAAGMYSSRCSYTRIVHVIRVTIPRDWRTRVYHVGLDRVEGMVTLDAVPIAPDAWAATWLRTRRASAYAEQGVILRVGERVIHGRDLADCRRIAKRRDAEAVRQARSVPTDPVLLAAQYGSVRVFRADSIRAGNCPSGTDEWIQKVMPDRRSATVAELLAADGGNSLVVLACVRAVRQRG